MATSPYFEWQFAAHEDEWAALTASPVQPAPRPARQRRHSPRLWALAALLLLLAGSGGYALERTAHAGWQAIEQDLQNAVAADAWMDQPAAATVQLMQVEVQGTQALVRAVVTQTLPSGEIIAYQTADVYAEGAAGWQRVTPSLALLGPQQTLATRYFQLRYYAVDAEIARALASRLDALYEQACASFGLSPTFLSHQMEVELVMDSRKAVGYVWLFTSRGASEAIRLPSPLLLRLPVDQPAAEAMYQAATGSVVRAVLWYAAPQMQLDVREFQWKPLLDAIYLWQVWQAGGALADERETLIHQYYSAVPSPDAIAACRADLFWQRATWPVLQICSDLAAQATRVAEGRLPARPPNQLMQLATADNGSGMRPWGETVALELLVEYAVARYGVERLPALLRALDDYGAWDGLLQAVYGVSASDFEQGWQDYVDAQSQPAGY
ncbi:MAG TPA: hypothetical protein VNK95_25555 [Caldilineaceae bacterium]|nr:hypothetical protein [Caldilineaceae bacterium]